MSDRWSDLNERAIELMQQGSLEEAATCLQQALAAARSENGEQHESVAVTLNNLGELYHIAGAYDQAKPHMEILANETFDILQFCESLSIDDLENGFQQDYLMALRTKDQLISAVTAAGDSEFQQALEERFAPFQIATPPN